MEREGKKINDLKCVSGDFFFTFSSFIRLLTKLNLLRYINTTVWTVFAFARFWSSCFICESHNRGRSLRDTVLRTNTIELLNGRFQLLKPITNTRRRWLLSHLKIWPIGLTFQVERKGHFSDVRMMLGRHWFLPSLSDEGWCASRSPVAHTP